MPPNNDLDLLVQPDSDVVASTSTHGGFAFARSGNTMAVTGPDGAQIIRLPEAETGTTSPSPSPGQPPSEEGGNNNVGFES